MSTIISSTAPHLVLDGEGAPPVPEVVTLEVILDEGADWCDWSVTAELGSVRGYGYSHDSEREATVGALRELANALEAAPIAVVETAPEIPGRLVDHVGEIEISTAPLFTGGWETMVFRDGDEVDSYLRDGDEAESYRYSTDTEAYAGHQRTVERYRDRQP